MVEEINAIINLRTDLLSNWVKVNPIAEKGEACYVIDENKLKIGDGVTPFTMLEYITVNQEDINNLLKNYAKNEIVNALGERVTEIENAGYQNAEQVNAIVDGKGYATTDQIPTDNASLANGAGYQTVQNVEDIIAGKGYITNADVESKGYQNEEQVNATIAGKNYVAKDGFATVNGQEITNGGNIEVKVPADVVTEESLAKKNLQNADQVEATIAGKNYVPKDNFATVNGQDITSGGDIEVKVPADVVTTPQLEAKGYQNADQVNAIVDGKNFMQVAETITVPETDANLNIQTNKIYNCTAAELTTLTIASIQNSPVESVIYFNSGNTPTVITITPEMTIIGDVTALEKNKKYVISIKNNYLAIAHDGAGEIDWADIANTPIIPTATSELNNDSGFVESKQLNTINGERIDQGQNINIVGGLEPVELDVTQYNENDIEIEVEANKIYRLTTTSYACNLHTIHLKNKNKNFTGLSYIITDRKIEFWGVESYDFNVANQRYDDGVMEHIITIAGDYRSSIFANVDLYKRANSYINGIQNGIKNEISGVENLDLYVEESNSIEAPIYLNYSGTFMYKFYNYSKNNWDVIHIKGYPYGAFSILVWDDNEFTTKDIKFYNNDNGEEYKRIGKIIYDETGVIKRKHVVYIFQQINTVVFADELYYTDFNSFLKAPENIEIPDTEAIIDIFENKNYKLTAPELTSLKINMCSDFPLESNIYFRSGSTPTTISILPSFNTIIGNVTNLSPDTNYIITIKNMTLEIKKSGDTNSAVKWEDIQNKPTIPTDNSELTNGNGYITMLEVENKEYQTAQNVEDIIAAKDYATSTRVTEVESKIPTDNKNLTNGAGYQTSEQVTATVDAKAIETEAKIPQTTEAWTFTMDDGTTLSKTVYVK